MSILKLLIVLALVVQQVAIKLEVDGCGSRTSGTKRSKLERVAMAF